MNRQPKPDAPSALLTVIGIPGDASNGYPYALQAYNEPRNKWDWIITGLADNKFNRTKDETVAALREEFGSKTTKTMSGWYRWVKVLEWQVAPNDGKGGKKWFAESLEATEDLIPIGLGRISVKPMAAKNVKAKNKVTRGKKASKRKTA